MESSQILNRGASKEKPPAESPSKENPVLDHHSSNQSSNQPSAASSEQDVDYSSSEEAIDDVSEESTAAPAKTESEEDPNADKKPKLQKENSSDCVNPEMFEPVPSKFSAVEENYETIYEQRARLFVREGNDWKARATGGLKIQQHRAYGNYRMLMLKTDTGIMCLKHVLGEDTIMKPMSHMERKTWTWFGNDFSDGKGVEREYAARFNTTNAASDFKIAFDRARAAAITRREAMREEETYIYPEKSDEKEPKPPVAT